MSTKFDSRGSFSFPAMHTGENPQNIILKAETSGDAGIYQEIAVAAFIKDECIADILVGLNNKGELRVILTANGEGDGDKRIAVYPQRPEAAAVEHFD